MASPNSPGTIFPLIVLPKPENSNRLFEHRDVYKKCIRPFSPSLARLANLGCARYSNLERGGCCFLFGGFRTLGHCHGEGVRRSDHGRNSLYALATLHACDVRHCRMISPRRCARHGLRRLSKDARSKQAEPYAAVSLVRWSQKRRDRTHLALASEEGGG